MYEGREASFIGLGFGLKETKEKKMKRKRMDCCHDPTQITFYGPITLWINLDLEAFRSKIFNLKSWRNFLDDFFAIFLFKFVYFTIHFNLCIIIVNPKFKGPVIKKIIKSVKHYIFSSLFFSFVYLNIFFKIICKK